MMRRIFAFIIDVAVANYLLFITVAFLDLDYSFYPRVSKLDAIATEAIMLPATFIVCATLMRLAFRRTLGEILTKLVPRQGDGVKLGGAPSIAQLMSRSIISGLTLFFPWVWAIGLFGDKRTLTDRMTATVLSLGTRPTMQIDEE